MGLTGIEPRGGCPAPGEKVSKQSGDRQCRNTNLKMTGTPSGKILHSSWNASLRDSNHRDASLGTKELAGAISFPHLSA